MALDKNKLLVEVEVKTTGEKTLNELNKEVEAISKTAKTTTAPLAAMGTAIKGVSDKAGVASTKIDYLSTSINKLISQISVKSIADLARELERVGSAAKTVLPDLTALRSAVREIGENTSSASGKVAIFSSTIDKLGSEKSVNSSIRLADGIAKVGQAAAAVAAPVAAMGGAVKGMAENSVAGAQRVRDFSLQLGRLDGKATSEAMGEVSRGIGRTAKAANEARVPVSAMNGALRTLSEVGGVASANVQLFGVTMNKFVGQMFAVNQVMQVGHMAMRIMGIVAGATIGNFLQYEKAMVAVAKTTNDSSENVHKLGLAFRDMSTVLPRSAAELGQIAALGAQLGVRGSDNLLLFTETISRFADSTNVSSEQAALSMTKILNITKTPISGIKELASSIVLMGNNFATTEGQIVAITNEVARSGAVYGISAKDAVAYGTALSQLGVRAESGGTQMTLLFGAVNKLATQGGPKFNRMVELMGTSAEAFKTKFAKDAGGAVQDFINALSKIKKDQLKPTLDAIGLTGTRAMSILGPLIKNVDDLNTALSMVDAEKGAALMTESERAYASVGARLEMLKNSFVNVGIAIGETLAPAVGYLADRLRALIVGIGSVIVWFNSIEWKKYESAAIALGISIGLLGTAFLTMKVVALGASNAVVIALYAIGDALVPLFAGLARLRVAFLSLYATAAPILAIIASLTILAATIELIYLNWGKLGRLGMAVLQALEQLVYKGILAVQKWNLEYNEFLQTILKIDRVDTIENLNKSVENSRKEIERLDGAMAKNLVSMDKNNKYDNIKLGTLSAIIKGTSTFTSELDKNAKALQESTDKADGLAEGLNDVAKSVAAIDFNKYLRDIMNFDVSKLNLGALSEIDSASLEVYGNKYQKVVNDAKAAQDKFDKARAAGNKQAENLGIEAKAKTREIAKVIFEEEKSNQDYIQSLIGKRLDLIKSMNQEANIGSSIAFKTQDELSKAEQIVQSMENGFALMVGTQSINTRLMTQYRNTLTSIRVEMDALKDVSEKKLKIDTEILRIQESQRRLGVIKAIVESMVSTLEQQVALEKEKFSFLQKEIPGYEQKVESLIYQNTLTKIGLQDQILALELKRQEGGMTQESLEYLTEKIKLQKEFNDLNLIKQAVKLDEARPVDAKLLGQDFSTAIDYFSPHMRDEIVKDFGEGADVISESIEKSSKQLEKAGASVSAGLSGGGIGSALSGIWDGLGLAVDSAVTMFDGIWESARTSFDTIFRENGPVNTALFRAAKGMADFIVGGIAPITEMLPITQIKDVIKWGANFMVAAAKLDLTSLGSLMGQAVSVFKDAVMGFMSVDFVSGLAGSVQSMAELPTKLLEAWKSVFTNLDKFLLMFADAFVKLLAQLPAVIQGIMNKLPEIMMAVIDAFGQLMASIPNLFDRIIREIPKLLNQLMQALPGMITSLFEAIPLVIASILRQIPAVILGIINHLPEILEKLIAGLLGATAEIAVAMVEIFVSAAPKIVSSLIKSIPKLIKALVMGVVNGIARGLKAMFGGTKFPAPRIIDDEEIGDVMSKQIGIAKKAATGFGEDIFKIIDMQKARKRAGEGGGATPAVGGSGTTGGADTGTRRSDTFLEAMFNDMKASWDRFLGTAGDMGEKVEKSWDRFLGTSKDFGQDVQSAWDRFLGTSKDFGQDVQSAWDRFLGTGLDIGTNIKAAWDDFLSTGEDLSDTFDRLFSLTPSDIQDKFQQSVNKFIGTGDDLGRKWQESSSKFFGTAEDMGSKMNESLNKFFGATVDVWEKMKESWDRFIGTTLDVGEKIMASVDKFLGPVKDIGTAVLNNLKELLGQHGMFAQALDAMIAKVTQALVEMLVKAGTAVGELVGNFTTKFQEILDQVFGGLGEKLSAGWDNLMNGLKDLLNPENFLPDMSILSAGVVDQPEWLTGLGPSVSEAFNMSTPTWVTNLGPTLTNAFSLTTPAWLTSLGTTIKSAFNVSAPSWITSIGTTIKSAFTISAPSWLTSIGATIKSAFTVSAPSWITNASSIMSKIFSIPSSAYGSRGSVEKLINLDVPFVSFSKGGSVPGKALFGGDNPSNDTVPALLSPGEVVIPRSLMGNPDIASFIQRILKTGQLETHAMGGYLGKLGKQISASPVTEAVVDVVQKLSPDQLIEEARRKYMVTINGYVGAAIKKMMDLGFYKGGEIPHFETGGLIQAHDGEYVLKKAAVNSLGVGTVEKLNTTGRLPDSNSSTYNSKIEIAPGAIIIQGSNMKPEDIAKEVLKQIKRKSQDGEFIISAAGIRA